MKEARRRWSWLACGWIGLVVAGSVHAFEESPTTASGVRVADGFEVTLYADDNLASNIYSMTIDSRGRVVVAGPRYVKILHDRDGDGRAESFSTFSDVPTGGAQGLFFDGNDLLATGDGALWRLRDADRDSRADGPPERILKIRAGGEHDAHAIRRGPDGWFYLLAGNGAGVTADYASLKSSPIRSPSAGTLLRLPPTLQGSEILVDGFRNAYDFAFNGQGDIFVYDSDGERDVSLPWYRPTRVFHALPAHGAGWFSRSWKRPGYFLDMPPVVGAFGRGSPTGVACYRHTGFPEQYRGVVFACDWTFGRVMAVSPPGPRMSGLPEPIEFMTGRGHFGFAPTDIAIGPDGSLFVAVGGRGTRGSVYRVTHPASTRSSLPRRETPMGTCLGAAQPLASWSRSRWLPLARKLGAAAFHAVILDAEYTVPRRVRAVEILVDLFGGPEFVELEKQLDGLPAAVRSRLAWAVGRGRPTHPDARLLSRFLADEDPRVGRAACEALLGISGRWDWDTVESGLLTQLDSPDRRTRQAAASVVARMPEAAWRRIRSEVSRRSPRARVAVAQGGRAHVQGVDRDALSVALEVLTTKNSQQVSEGLKLDAARLAQLALGDVGPVRGRAAVFDGYGALLSPAALSPVAGEVSRVIDSVFPSGSRELDDELARVTAMIASAEPRLLAKFLASPDPRSHPVTDLHLLITAARIPLARTSVQREQTARILVGLQAKIDRGGLNQDSNWDDRVGELYVALCENDPRLPRAVLETPGFGLPSHVLFLGRMSRQDRARAREAFVVAIRKAGEDYPWTGEVVRLLGESVDPKSVDLLRSVHDRADVRGAVVVELARRATAVDRQRFVNGLESSSLEVVGASLSALAKLPAEVTGEEQLALLGVVRRMGATAQEHGLRSRAVMLLRRNTGRRFGFVTGKTGRRAQQKAVAAWTEHLEAKYPGEARKLLGAAAASLSGLKRQLEAIDWARGDVTRGKRIFAKRGCVQCHQGRRALGPDLAGSAGRFSRVDLFTAIVLPSRDVSPRYQTTVVQTDSGQVYSGLIVYQSVDGVTLRTGTNRTIRLERGEIEFQSRRSESLMPMGLLKGLEDSGYADLYAYLASLRK
ncbi:MAG: hypothetical protein CMJ68_21515 [Planctomycetaceae bacterium]|nr:hypothetical protein [Planctomycetaceae bacterium]